MNVTETGLDRSKDESVRLRRPVAVATFASEASGRGIRALDVAGTSLPWLRCRIKIAWI